MRMVLASFVLLLSVFANAKEGGNGGVSVVCRNDKGGITKAELLDTFELRNMHGLTEATFISEEEALEYVLARLDRNRNYKDTFLTHYKRIKQKTVFLEEGVAIDPTEDAFPILRNKKCKFEQLAVYTEHGKLLVDSEIYKHLNLINQVALTVHEVIFYIDRVVNKATSSSQSRTFTAHLLAKENEVEALDTFLKTFFRSPLPRDYQLSEYSNMYQECKVSIAKQDYNSFRITYGSKCRLAGESYIFDKYNFKRRTWTSDETNIYVQQDDSSDLVLWVCSESNIPNPPCEWFLHKPEW